LAFNPVGFFARLQKEGRVKVPLLEAIKLQPRSILNVGLLAEKPRKK